MTRAFIQYEAAPPPPAPAGGGPASGPGGVPRERRVFISYAHDDGAPDGSRSADLPRAFFDELARLCADHPQYGIRREGIFFDRHGLLPGTMWSAQIASALAASEIVFFLVSSHALASRFCMDEEVGAAVAAGKCLVPVILTDCRWVDSVVQAGQQRFRLGDFQAVPKDAQFKLRPVELWEHRSSAWKAVIEQIQRLLAAPPALPGPLGSALPPGPALATLAAGPAPPAHAPGAVPTGTPAELLPFTCDQTPVAQHFRLQLRRWQPQQALLVLLKGVYDDELPSFMRRLAEQDLAPRCAKAGLPLLERRPVKDWPSDDDPLLPDYVQMALATALTGDADSIIDGASLSAALAQQPGLRPLLLGVLEAGPALAKGLQAALGLIESAPADAPLQRMALVLTLEDPALIADPAVAKTLGLDGFARTHVIELARMQALEDDDVGKWFDDNELQRHFSEGRPAFVQRLFEGRSELRMRPFAQVTQRLLTLR
jgi:hypothetical protein